MAVSKRKTDINKIISSYEKKQERMISSIMQQILALMDEKVTGLAFVYAKRKLINNRLLPKDIREAIDRISNTITAKTRDLIITGVRQSFLNSYEKNHAIAKEYLGSGRKVPPGALNSIIDASSGGGKKGVYTAVDAYIERKTAGLGLSKRIWKLSPSFKKMVNDTMIKGLKEGAGAKGKKGLGFMLRDSLRVNDFQDNPGRGIYKSPQKNAERVARTEINMAYRNADAERWKDMWFIIGIEVRLSNNHRIYDICDNMKGKYPKDFRFIGWHPNCRCAAIPILASQELRDQYMDYQLGLRPEPPVVPYIQSLPGSAKTWMQDNSERIAGWKNTPFWVTANKSKVSRYLQ